MILDRESQSVTTVPPVTARPKLLAVVTVDIMAWVLLRPWLEGLQNAGYEVHIACARGKYYDQLVDAGFIMHPVAMRRTFNIFAHIVPFFELCKVLRSQHFVAVNTHSPVAAALGRSAAAICGAHPIIYTVHGFYFHDRMTSALRWPLVAMEWLFGRWTDAFMFVSDEDRRTARRLGICATNALSRTILNGVNMETYHPPSTSAVEAELGQLHGLRNRPVVGIVGRIVKEKGYREFLEMATALTESGVDATYLVVGDSLPSDRDQFGPVLREQVAKAGLAERFVFTGMTDRVPDYLALMDIFVLPSYREGFPRSILEAMATGLPVVSTDIRGCREAVIEGVTGHIVPPRDAVALRVAVQALLSDPARRREMGDNARRIACEKYDYIAVRERFVGFFQKCIDVNEQLSHEIHGLSRASCVVIAMFTALISVFGLYAVPALIELRWFGKAHSFWPIVVAGDAPGSLIIGLIQGWRWGLIVYLCLSIVEALLLKEGVLAVNSLVWFTNLIPAAIIIGFLFPRILNGQNWRSRK
jgi:glycosyltransferase involved in cell wall biosynthesis